MTEEIMHEIFNMTQRMSANINPYKIIKHMEMRWDKHATLAQFYSLDQRLFSKVMKRKALLSSVWDPKLGPIDLKDWLEFIQGIFQSK